MTVRVACSWLPNAVSSGSASGWKGRRCRWSPRVRRHGSADGLGDRDGRVRCSQRCGSWSGAGFGSSHDEGGLIGEARAGVASVQRQNRPAEGKGGPLVAEVGALIVAQYSLGLPRSGSSVELRLVARSRQRCPESSDLEGCLYSGGCRSAMMRNASIARITARVSVQAVAGLGASSPGARMVVSLRL